MNFSLKITNIHQYFTLHILITILFTFTFRQWRPFLVRSRSCYVTATSTSIKSWLFYASFNFGYKYWLQIVTVQRMCKNCAFQASHHLCRFWTILRPIVRCNENLIYSSAYLLLRCEFQLAKILSPTDSWFIINPDIVSMTNEEYYSPSEHTLISLNIILSPLLARQCGQRY